MRICIPIMEDRGVESAVCEHFGSAPAFLIVDTETNQTRAIVNGDQHHAHGMCQPLSALASQAIDGMVVGGIGRGALLKLQAANIQVFLSGHATVAETLTALKENRLQPVGLEHACAQHGQGAGGHGGGVHR